MTDIQIRGSDVGAGAASVETKTLTIKQAINETLFEEMRRDPTIVILGCDVGIRGNPFGVTKGLYEEFGAGRVLDTPISEAAIIGSSLGAAATGLRPIAEILFSDWITIGMDQLVNQVAKIRYMFGGAISVPLVIRTPHAKTGRRVAAPVSNADLFGTLVDLVGLPRPPRLWLQCVRARHT